MSKLLDILDRRIADLDSRLVSNIVQEAILRELIKVRAELAAELEKAPVVYGSDDADSEYPNGGWMKWDELLEPTSHTHKARLVDVETLTKEGNEK